MINLRKHSCKKEGLVCGNTGRRTNGDGPEEKRAPETTQGKGFGRNYLKIPGVSGVSASGRGEGKVNEDSGF